MSPDRLFLRSDAKAPPEYVAGLIAVIAGAEADRCNRLRTSS